MSEVNNKGRMIYGKNGVTGVVVSPAISLFEASKLSAQVVTENGTSTGSAKLLASVDGVNFIEVTDSSQALADGMCMFEYPDVCAPQYKVSVTLADGAGVAASAAIVVGGGGALSFVADAVGVSGDGIQVVLEEGGLKSTGSITGSVGVLDFEAVVAGVAGDSIEVVLADTAVAGAETISVLGTVITVGIESGVSIASDIAALIEGDVDASALVSVIATEGAMEADSVTLTGGSDCEVSVVDRVITCSIVGGVTLSSIIKVALDANVDAAALIDTTVDVDDVMPSGLDVTLGGGLNEASDVKVYVYIRQ